MNNQGVRVGEGEREQTSLMEERRRYIHCECVRECVLCMRVHGVELYRCSLAV